MSLPELEYEIGNTITENTTYPGYIYAKTFLAPEQLKGLLDGLDIDNHNDKESHVYHRVTKPLISAVDSGSLSCKFSWEMNVY